MKKAVVIGAGFIGLEAAENLQAKGIQVTVIDFADQILPNIFDPEMALYAKRHLIRQGIRVLTGTKAEQIYERGTQGRVAGIKTSAGNLPCEMIIMAAGIRPNTEFLNDSGIEMFKGTILTDDQMKTNLDDVYAAGDCVMVKNRLTGKTSVVTDGIFGESGRTYIGTGTCRSAEVVSGSSRHRRCEASGSECRKNRTDRSAGKRSGLRCSYGACSDG